MKEAEISSKTVAQDWRTEQSLKQNKRFYTQKN